MENPCWFDGPTESNGNVAKTNGSTTEVKMCKGDYTNLRLYAIFMVQFNILEFIIHIFN